MVLKHPMMFLGADVVAINKIDLSSVMQVDPDKLAKDVQRINPKTQTIPISCRQGLGIREVQKALALNE
jgi:Ni2+-binding GTPase involved in maturation of urease and hydrogenase